MNVVPLALIAQMMDQRINSPVYVRVFRTLQIYIAAITAIIFQDLPPSDLVSTVGGVTVDKSRGCGLGSLVCLPLEVCTNSQWGKLSLGNSWVHLAPKHTL